MQFVVYGVATYDGFDYRSDVATNLFLTFGEALESCKQRATALATELGDEIFELHDHGSKIVKGYGVDGARVDYSVRTFTIN